MNTIVTFGHARAVFGTARQENGYKMATSPARDLRSGATRVQQPGRRGDNIPRKVVMAARSAAVRGSAQIPRRSLVLIRFAWRFDVEHGEFNRPSQLPRGHEPDVRRPAVEGRVSLSKPPLVDVVLHAVAVQQHRFVEFGA